MGTMRFTALLVLLTATACLAGPVTRPTKTCGTTNYSTEVTAGCVTIKAAEVDADLNAIIGGVNDITTAQIDAAGLGTAAYANSSITSAKIATNTVTGGASGNLALSTITNANIVPGTITGGTSGSIGSATITHDNIANQTIQSAQLAINSTIHAGADSVTVQNFNTTTVEKTIVTIGPMTSRGGGFVLITGGWGLFCSLTGTAGTYGYTLTVKRDGTPIVTIDGTCGANTVTTFAAPVPFPTVLDITAGAGAHTWTVTGKTGDSNLGLFTPNTTNQGTGFALEFS